MTKVRLLDLLRRATALSAGQRLILAGSQAYYAATASALPLVERSEEADLLLVGVNRGLFLQLEDALGMESPHLRETGVFAHPVGLGTIVLPAGWEERLVPFGRDEGLVNVWALEIHDLAASKLMAGRDKDFEFLRALLDHGLCDFPTLLARMELLRAAPAANAVPERLAKLGRHLRNWGRDDLARTIGTSTDVPHFDKP
jgi:hypothetical protein